MAQTRVFFTAEMENFVKNYRIKIRKNPLLLDSEDFEMEMCRAFFLYKRNGLNNKVENILKSFTKTH